MAELSPRAMTRELFRYANVRAPRILDLSRRSLDVPDSLLAAAGEPQTRASQTERRKWAQAHLKSDAHVSGLADLGLKSLKHLAFEEAPEDRLPSRTAIRDEKAFAAAVAKEAPAIAAAKKKLATSLFAAVILNDMPQTQRLSRALQVLEALPVLVRTQSRKPYAPVVLSRHADARDRSNDKDDGATELVAPTEPSKAPSAILMAWDLANEYKTWTQRNLTTREAALKTKRFVFSPPDLPKRLTEKDRKAKLAEARRKQYRDHSKARAAERAAIATDRASLSDATPRAVIAKMAGDEDFTRAMAEKYGLDVGEVLAAVDVKGKPQRGFCAVYKASAEVAENAGRPNRANCEPLIDNPCVLAFSRQRRALSGGDDVRLLGVAELITVDEEFMGYRPGEISAIETVMKGELREKETKTARYFEEISEDTTTTTDEKETETTTSTEQELQNQIEQELTTRFSSDLTAEASGEGGGTIGVVNFEGAASVGTAMGVGIDSSLSQSSDDRFSQEIVARAVERTKTVTTKLRRQRNYRLFETKVLNKIDNTDPAATNFNAVFCYLDKEVCIKERLYGLRPFLGAELMRPGQELLKQELRRHAVDLAELGRVPEFDLTPAMITPENYMSLVGRYRAANVMPPPPIIRMESRTYRTDTASEAREPQKSMVETVADTLAPFFGNYRRYLIQDQIEVPQGYRVQQVDMTVSHGNNGVSVPAHLPFSILGAAIYATPTLGAAAIPPYTLFYLPVAVWQMLYTASPLMHVHADSSHVTMTVGHQAQESRYFFFDPEQMLRDMLEAIEASTMLDGGLLDRLRGHMTALFSALSGTATGSLQDALEGLSAPVADYIAALSQWLDTLVNTVFPFLNNENDDDETATTPVPPQPPTITPELFAAVPEAIIAPFETFFTDVIGELGDLMNDFLGDLFAFLQAETRNVDTYSFGQMAGLTGAVPVSLNCVALKPGVTVNLTACLVRIDEEALDLWRLETFERLSQAHAQLEAEHAARVASGLERTVLRGNPTILRAEEKLSLKTRVMDRLHAKYSATPDQPMTLDEAQLFEHVIDWENMTHRLFNYEPEGAQVAYEALGLYATADRARRGFLDAAWTKVMLPLREDERLEQVFLSYMRSGRVDFEADLLGTFGSDEPALDELTAIYRDLVLRRGTEPGCALSARYERIPTDLVVIHQGSPEDPYPSSDVDCSPDCPGAP